METLYLLIPMSVALVFLIGGLFWWSLRNGQYDDLEGPGYRILMDDDRSEAQSVAQPEVKPGVVPEVNVPSVNPAVGAVMGKEPTSKPFD